MFCKYEFFYFFMTAHIKINFHMSSIHPSAKSVYQHILLSCSCWIYELLLFPVLCSTPKDGNIKKAEVLIILNLWIIDPFIQNFSSFLLHLDCICPTYLQLCCYQLWATDGFKTSRGRLGQCVRDRSFSRASNSAWSCVSNGPRNVDTHSAIVYLSYNSDIADRMSRSM